MKFKTATVSLLVICISILSMIATLIGIFSNQGPGPYEYESIRGQSITIYGRGIYQHMSAEVAPQGIAQDNITLSLGIPLLFISLYYSRKGLLKGKLWLTATLGYFLVTYLFYMLMGMYNNLFLIYVLLTSTSFFAFLLTIMSFDIKNLHRYFSQKQPIKLIGGFLMFNAAVIGLLWLSIVVPPLVNGKIPIEVEHYTTLVVQGLDLAILLPSSFISGVLILKRKPFGYLFATIFINFLVILMTALTAKVIGMSIMGFNVGPALIIIPLFNLTAIICATFNLRSIQERL